MEAGGADKTNVKKQRVKFRASTIIQSPKNKDFESIVENNSSQKLMEKASSSLLLSPHESEKPRNVIKGHLQIDANELFMVSQYLKQDIKPMNDPRCLIDYSRKPDRDYYYDYIAGPHEGRFDNINRLPHPLTNIRHVGGPSFKQTSRR